MKIDKIADEFINTLRLSGILADVKIIEAYPNLTKPTRLSKPVVSVSACNMDLSVNGIGEDNFAGEYAVNVNIYIAKELGAYNPAEIFGRICKAADNLLISGVKADDVKFDRTSDCFVLKSVFTFNNQFDFGGGENE